VREFDDFFDEEQRLKSSECFDEKIWHETRRIFRENIESALQVFKLFIIVLETQFSGNCRR
jgi:hypothetical protein